MDVDWSAEARSQGRPVPPEVEEDRVLQGAWKEPALPTAELQPNDPDRRPLPPQLAEEKALL